MALTNLILIGGSGQVGRAWIELARAREITLQVFTRRELDLLNPSAIKNALTTHVKPGAQAVVIAAAYTQVDLAETEVEAARAVNALSVREIAEWCAERKIPVLHYSTDYVYSGDGHAERTESEPTHPLGVYGATKLEGENAIRTSGAQHLIFRTSWVYDAHGKNFFRTMLKLGETRPELRVVCDQIGAPTYAPHLVQASLNALSSHAPWGTYHLCAPGETSWFDFAAAIFNRMHVAAHTPVPALTPIPASAYPTPAKRPLNSRLDLTRARLVLGVDFDRDLPHWSKGLDACIQTYIQAYSNT